MAYKPSLPRLPDGEPWASMQRLANESRQVLAEADIVGRTEDDARRRIEAAGLVFRQSATAR